MAATAVAATAALLASASAAMDATFAVVATSLSHLDGEMKRGTQTLNPSSLRLSIHRGHRGIYCPFQSPLISRVMMVWVVTPGSVRNKPWTSAPWRQKINNEVSVLQL